MQQTPGSEWVHTYSDADQVRSTLYTTHSASRANAVVGATRPMSDEPAPEGEEDGDADSDAEDGEEGARPKGKTAGGLTGTFRVTHNDFIEYIW